MMNAQCSQCWVFRHRPSDQGLPLATFASLVLESKCRDHEDSFRYY